jgi:hypothetical protein
MLSHEPAPNVQEGTTVPYTKQFELYKHCGAAAVRLLGHISDHVNPLKTVTDASGAQIPNPFSPRTVHLRVPRQCVPPSSSAHESHQWFPSLQRSAPQGCQDLRRGKSVFTLRQSSYNHPRYRQVASRQRLEKSKSKSSHPSPQRDTQAT